MKGGKFWMDYRMKLIEKDGKWNESVGIWTSVCPVRVEHANHYTIGGCYEMFWNFESKYEYWALGCTLFFKLLDRAIVSVLSISKEVLDSGNLELVKMVAPYIKLDAPLYHGQNALHIAAHKGYIDIFKFLLEKAESANPRDNINQTPYDVGTDEIKKYLASEYKSRKIGWYKWS